MKEVFENENYRVVVDPSLDLVFYNNDYLGGYAVVNKVTAVTEFMTTSMPEALYNAEQLNAALTSEAWKWRSKETPPSSVPANPLSSALN